MEVVAKLLLSYATEKGTGSRERAAVATEGK